MHRLSSRYAVTRFKLAAWVLFFMFLMIPSTFGVLIYSMATVDREFLELALAFIAATAFLALLQWCLSFRARCPLCHAKSISHDGCSKHRNARPLFGSYRLRVACTVIFREYFRCPYCGESTAVKARTGTLPTRRRY
ncbi:MAG: hypothetical protein ABIT37_25025 [Luteolibacter sp.]